MIKMAKPTSISREPATRVTAVFAVVLALGIVAVLAILASHVVAGGHRSAARHPGHPGPSAASRPPAPKGSPLRLTTGTGWVNGIYTRYPRTFAGAVSAAVEFITELGSTLNPDRAATVARLTADSSYRSAAQDAAASVIAARRALGVPASGPLPDGTGAFLVPVMYQLREAGPASGSGFRGGLTVLLLYNYTLTAQSGAAEHVGVTAVRLTWTPASWRMLTPPAHDLAALLAMPGTAEATAKGWEAMTNGL
jgi:hypothetical protein